MTRLPPWIPAMLAVGLLASGCDGDEAPEAGPSPASTSSAPTATTAVESTPPARNTTPPALVCPNQEAASTDDSLRIGGSLEGDFDGDGQLEEAVIHLDPKAEIGCRAFVVVDGTQGPLSVPVWLLDETAGLTEPSLAFTTEMNGATGAEIVVNEAAGASTQFLGVLTVADGSLQRVSAAVEGPEHFTGEAAGIFPSGGSVGHAEAVDCVGPGRVVVSEAVPARDPEVFRVIRRFYRVQGAVIVPDGVARDRVAARDLNATPEFGSSPFGSCG